MRTDLRTVELVAPPDLAGVLALLATGEHRPFAGGTDLMVLAEAGTLPAARFVSLWHLDALRGVTIGDEGARLGALTTYTDVRAHAELGRDWPLLARAAAETGGIAIQNRGTLGGNVANASPAADSPPALLVYDAELELLSARGTRRVPYADFHLGYRRMDLRPDEIIAAVHLPARAAGWRDAYHKVGTRRAQAISKVCFAGAALLDGDRVRDVRLAWGSVAPVPLRARRTEAVLRGERLGPALLRAAGEELGRELAPVDDFRSTAEYRRRVAQNLLAAWLDELGRG